MSVETPEYDKPLPVADDLTAPFWQAARAGRLVVQRCAECGAYQHYPRPFCTHCEQATPAWVEASGEGVVHTFTVVERADDPSFNADVPYVYAIVETAEGVRMAGNVVGVDPARVAVGMPVRATFVEVTADVSLPQWEPR